MSPVELAVPRSDLIPVSNERVSQIVETGRPHYKSDGSMLFHDWDHAVAVTNNYMKEWVYGAENGIETDFEAGVGAAVHHDSDYHKKLKGFESKESRSASIAARKLKTISFTPEQIALSKRGIMATKLGRTCEDTFEKQMVRADLANVAFDYRRFLKFFVRLAREQRQLTGMFKPFEEVRDTQVAVLTTYFNQDLSYPFEKSCPFISKGLMNILLLKRADEREVAEITGEEFSDDA